MSNTTQNLQIGQTVHILCIGNAKRYYKQENWIQEWIITKIGRKYLTAKRKDAPEWSAYQFDIHDNFRQKNNESEDYLLFLSKEDLLAYQVRTEQEIEIYQSIHSILPQCTRQLPIV